MAGQQRPRLRASADGRPVVVLAGPRRGVLRYRTVAAPDPDRPPAPVPPAAAARLGRRARQLRPQPVARRVAVLLDLVRAARGLRRLARRPPAATARRWPGARVHPAHAGHRRGRLRRAERPAHRAAAGGRRAGPAGGRLPGRPGRRVALGPRLGRILRRARAGGRWPTPARRRPARRRRSARSAAGPASTIRPRPSRRPTRPRRRRRRARRSGRGGLARAAAADGRPGQRPVAAPPQPGGPRRRPAGGAAGWRSAPARGRPCPCCCCCGGGYLFRARTRRAFKLDGGRRSVQAAPGRPAAAGRLRPHPRPVLPPHRAAGRRQGRQPDAGRASWPAAGACSAPASGPSWPAARCGPGRRCWTTCSRRARRWPTPWAPSTWTPGPR